MPPLFDNFDGRKMLALVPYWRCLADGTIPSPLANSLDLSSAGACPNRCYFCNVRWTQEDIGHMTDETMAQVLEVYRRFGVRSACIAGGGESLANPHCERYLQDIVDVGTDIGVITNGRLYRKLPAKCRFCNVSVNAATPEVYEMMCGVPGRHFEEVCENIQRWVADGQTVTYKVMITNRNKSATLLTQSVEKALTLGVKTVLFRFAMLPWNLVNSGADEYVTLTDVEADIFTAHIEVLRRHYPNLNIQMPLERYDRTSRKLIPKRCTGGAVNFVTLWNGDVSLCSDFRTCPEMRLCHISEFAQHWGSDRHKAILAAVHPDECPRCSFLLHDRIVDEFILNDTANQFFI